MSKPPGTRTRTKTRSRRGVSPLTVLGVILLLGGLGCLGYVVYQLFGTNIVADKVYEQEVSQLQNQWQQTPARKTSGQAAKPIPGGAIALMRIPRFGDSYVVPVLQGTDLATLAEGVGHYDNTALPGQIGNFAVAGHRITHGQPFSKLEQLKVGDQVIVETRTNIYTYRLDTAPAALTVKETATWVLDPVPNHPDETPTTALITLTTCQDLFHSPDRSVGFGTLVDTRTK